MSIHGLSPEDLVDPIPRLPRQRLIELRQLREEVEAGGRGRALRWERQSLVRLLLLDFQVGLAAGLAAYLLRFGQVPAANWPYLFASIALPIGWTLTLLVNRAYETRFLFAGGEE